MTCSVLDMDAWQTKVDAILQKPGKSKIGPILFVEVGCFIYLPTKEVSNIFKFIAKNYEKSEFLVDMVATDILKRGLDMGTKINWEFTLSQKNLMQPFLRIFLKSVGFEKIQLGQAQFSRVLLFKTILRSPRLLTS